MKLPDYTALEKEDMGEQIAEILCLRPVSRVENHRLPFRAYKTTWGTKSSIGIYETFVNLMGKIERGETNFKAPK